MPAGLQIFNDKNTIQIDGNYKNYYYREKLTATSSYGGASVLMQRLTLDLQGEDLLVAVYSPNYGIALSETSTITGGQRFVYYFPDSPQNVPVTCDFYVFCADYVPIPTSFGLEVFNELGQQVFSTERGYARIVGFAADQQAATGNKQFATSRKVATCLTGPITRNIVIAQSGAPQCAGGNASTFVQESLDGFQITSIVGGWNGTTWAKLVNAGECRSPQNSPQPRITQINGGQFLAIDVTGLN